MQDSEYEMSHSDDTEALADRVRKLEREREALRLEAWRQKRKPSGIIGYVLLVFGASSLLSSTLYSSSILAFIGLGLVFWGALLLYMRPAGYARSSLIDSTVIPSLITINQIITDLGIKGKAIYLPPRLLKEIKGGTAFIPAEKNKKTIPSVKELSEEKVFLKNPDGICLTPPGVSLVNLYENELGRDFTKTDLDYLKNNLPKLFIEGLGIADDVEINGQGKIIRVKITGSIYQDLCNEVRKLNIFGSLGCPLCSSLAIAITRATGKPVTIQRTEIPEDGKTIETYFKILEE